MINSQKLQINWLNKKAKIEQHRRRSLQKNNLQMQDEIAALKADIRKGRKMSKRVKNVLKRCRINNRMLKKENADLLANFDAFMQDRDSEIAKRDNLIKELIMKIENMSLTEAQSRKELNFEKDVIQTTKRRLDLDVISSKGNPIVKRPRLNSS